MVRVESFIIMRWLLLSVLFLVACSPAPPPIPSRPRVPASTLPAPVVLAPAPVPQAAPAPITLSYTDEVRGGLTYRIVSDGRVFVWFENAWITQSQYEQRVAIRARMDCMRQRSMEIALYGRPLSVC